MHFTPVSIYFQCPLFPLKPPHIYYLLLRADIAFLVPKYFFSPCKQQRGYNSTQLEKQSWRKHSKSSDRLLYSRQNRSFTAAVNARWVVKTRAFTYGRKKVCSKHKTEQEFKSAFLETSYSYRFRFNSPR